MARFAVKEVRQMTWRVVGVLVCVLFFVGCGDETECKRGDERSCGIWPCEGEQYCNAETGMWEECSSLGRSCGDCCTCVEVAGEVRAREVRNTGATENCDGRDNDCDGTTDEGCGCVPLNSSRECGMTEEGECRYGVQTCVQDLRTSPPSTSSWSDCIGEIGPVPESCPLDGLDNDCNGLVDDLFEICNGEDDDCDGAIDEDFICRLGSTGSCITSCGSTGFRTCNTSCSWGACTPPAETCNARDDDCDGAIDEDFICRLGSTGSCITSCGSTGSRTCNTSCSWGACTPPAETCNARDDDCDGSVDEDFACRQNSTGTCTTSCGSAGSRTCSSSCSWGTCAPPAEICGNGRDDDCDGSIDEGCCTDVDRDGYFARASGCPSGNDCDDSNAAIHPGATELCDGLDNDCNGSTDVIAPRTVANVTITHEVGCAMSDGCCDSPSIGVVRNVALDAPWFSGMARTRVMASVEYAYFARSCWNDAEIVLGVQTSLTAYRQPRVFRCEVQQSECGTTTPWGSLSQTWTFSSGEIPSSVFLDVVRRGDYGVKYRNWRVSVEVDCF